MGYTTEFDGEIEIDPPLNEAEQSWLNDFVRTRRMRRIRGPLFVGGSESYGQGHDDDIIDYNTPPRDQPGLWCQWESAWNGEVLQWNGVEKFYYAPEWMRYLIDNLFSDGAKQYVADHITEDSRLASFTCDHVFNGVIEAQGEESDDRWRLIVEDNVVKEQHARIVWDEE